MARNHTILRIGYQRGGELGSHNFHHPYYLVAFVDPLYSSQNPPKKRMPKKRKSAIHKRQLEA